MVDTPTLISIIFSSQMLANFKYQRGRNNPKERKKMDESNPC